MGGWAPPCKLPLLAVLAAVLCQQTGCSDSRDQAARWLWPTPVYSADIPPAEDGGPAAAVATAAAVLTRLHGHGAAADWRSPELLDPKGLRCALPDGRPIVRCGTSLGHDARTHVTHAGDGA
jgi:hypothetical protein